MFSVHHGAVHKPKSNSENVPQILWTFFSAFQKKIYMAWITIFKMTIHACVQTCWQISIFCHGLSSAIRWHTWLVVSVPFKIIPAPKEPKTHSIQFPLQTYWLELASMVRWLLLCLWFSWKICKYYMQQLPVLSFRHKLISITMFYIHVSKWHLEWYISCIREGYELNIRALIFSAPNTWVSIVMHSFQAQS